MRKVTFTSILVIFLVATSFAQKQFFGVAWEINFPTNGDYLTETSFAGGKMEYRYLIKDDLSVGLAWNWTSFEQYFNRQTLVKEDGNAAVTSDYVAQVYTVPLTATVHYYWRGNKRFRPYAGVALGGQYMEQRLYYNIYESNEYNWGFVGRPEIGTLIKLDPNGTFGFNVAATYSFATNKNGITEENSFKNFGISIGMAFGQ
jgi:outer membrane protein W